MLNFSVALKAKLRLTGGTFMLPPSLKNVGTTPTPALKCNLEVLWALIVAKEISKRPNKTKILDMVSFLI